jgi:hypothetical protein
VCAGSGGRARSGGVTTRRGLFRRRALPEGLQAPYVAFADQVRRVEEARDALMSCLPVGRVDPAPVPVGLDLLRDVLVEVRGELDAWRVEPVESEWQGVAEAIAESLAAIPRAHEVAESSDELEELLGAVEDVDEPLGYALQQAELRFRRLRR